MQIFRTRARCAITCTSHVEGYHSSIKVWKESLLSSIFSNLPLDVLGIEKNQSIDVVSWLIKDIILIHGHV